MKRKKVFKYIRRTLLVFVILTAVGLIAGSGLVFWVSRDLPSYTRVSDYRPQQVTTVYARDGSVMGYFYDEKRFLVSLGQMPPFLRQAFLAAEDASFYSHDGISFKAIVRAFWKNLWSGGPVEGGSTITQQVVKRLLLTPERSYIRKLKEAILAYRLESYLSKNDILNIYLNQIYLGSGAYGVEAAARTYFNKHVEELTLAEAAVLAGLPQSPSKVNPFADPEGTKTRQRYVLRRMLTEGMISQEVHDAAVNEPLRYAALSVPGTAFDHVLVNADGTKVGVWYLEEVRREVIRFLSAENARELNLPIDQYGRDAVYKSGLHIYTSMEPVHQAAAEKALRQGLLDAGKRHGWKGPIEQLATPEEIANFIKDASFTPQDLDNAGWAKAVVTAVNPKQAELRLGAFKGVISAKNMEWCRIPNPKRAPEERGQIRSPDKVLAVGDVVWVSAIGAKGSANPVGAPADAKTPAYDASKISADKPIALCLEQMPEVDGGLVSIETESGDVVAMVGGYTPPPIGHFNRITQGRRQPGSAFKPVVYSTALDLGYTAASMIEDAPVVSAYSATDPTLWRPSNFDGVFYGPILLRTALVRSRNLCTVRLAQNIGVPALIERAHLMGIDGNIQRDLSISLGSHAVTPLTMAEVYTSFATGGHKVQPRFIQRITDPWGQPIHEFAPASTETISPQNAYIISSILKDVVKSGTGYRAKGLKRIIGGKTGTTNEEKDAWFIGFSPFLVSTVYVGYDDNKKPMGKLETGSRVATPIFVDYRSAVEDLYPDQDFPLPEGVINVEIDEANGYLAGMFTEKKVTLPFLEGSEPRVVSGAPIQRGQDDLGSAIDLFKQ